MERVQEVAARAGAVMEKATDRVAEVMAAGLPEHVGVASVDGEDGGCAACVDGEDGGCAASVDGEDGGCAANGGDNDCAVSASASVRAANGCGPHSKDQASEAHGPRPQRRLRHPHHHSTRAKASLGCQCPRQIACGWPAQAERGSPAPLLAPQPEACCRAKSTTESGRPEPQFTGVFKVVTRARSLLQLAVNSCNLSTTGYTYSCMNTMVLFLSRLHFTCNLYEHDSMYDRVGRRGSIHDS